VGRFRSRAAFAVHDGTAPVPVWSGNHERHRLNRGGNRQLNTALHRIAVTQLRLDSPGRDYLQRRTTAGDTKTEALRALRRRISDEVYRRLHADQRPPGTPPTHLLPAARHRWHVSGTPPLGAARWPHRIAKAGARGGPDGHRRRPRHPPAADHLRHPRHRHRRDPPRAAQPGHPPGAARLACSLHRPAGRLRL
jgi:hypothetical protein